MKEQFIEFVEELMKVNPQVTKTLYNEDVKAYFEAFKQGPIAKANSEITDTGAKILKVFQEHYKLDDCRKGYKSSDIAESLGVTPKNVSGSIRKLCSDGYLEKIEDTKPIIYLLTDKGLNYIFD